MSANGEISVPEQRIIGRPWPKGVSGNPGGRPRALVEIERMLDDEHRTVDSVRKVFERLKALALDDTVSTWTDRQGNQHEDVRPPNPAFLKLYLDRLLGPVSDGNGDKVQELAQRLLDGMLDEARARRANGER